MELILKKEQKLRKYSKISDFKFSTSGDKKEKDNSHVDRRDKKRIINCGYRE
ncbi:MAG: hypothetical protein ACLUA8_08590 [Ligilactobacillus salivarius]